MASTSKSAATMDAITLLTDDHARVNKLFKAFQKAEKEDDLEAMEDVITTACAELDVHSKLEKELFYPAVREQADEELRDLLAEADVEHESVDALVHKLSEVKLDDEMYKASFTVLMEYVKHHVKEEEKEMFPKVRKLKRLDLDALGERMRARQEELMGDYLREAGYAAEDIEAAKAAMVAANKPRAKARTIRAHR